jgi:hypothetical protein
MLTPHTFDRLHDGAAEWNILFVVWKVPVPISKMKFSYYR